MDGAHEQRDELVAVPGAEPDHRGLAGPQHRRRGGHRVEPLDDASGVEAQAVRTELIDRDAPVLRQVLGHEGAGNDAALVRRERRQADRHAVEAERRHGCRHRGDPETGPAEPEERRDRGQYGDGGEGDPGSGGTVVRRQKARADERAGEKQSRPDSRTHDDPAASPTRAGEEAGGDRASREE